MFLFSTLSFLIFTNLTAFFYSLFTMTNVEESEKSLGELVYPDADWDALLEEFQTCQDNAARLAFFRNKLPRAAAIGAISANPAEIEGWRLEASRLYCKIVEDPANKKKTAAELNLRGLPGPWYTTLPDLIIANSATLSPTDDDTFDLVFEHGPIAFKMFFLGEEPPVRDLESEYGSWRRISAWRGFSDEGPNLPPCEIFSLYCATIGLEHLAPLIIRLHAAHSSARKQHGKEPNSYSDIFKERNEICCQKSDNQVEEGVRRILQEPDVLKHVFPESASWHSHYADQIPPHPDTNAQKLFVEGAKTLLAELRRRASE